MKNMPTISIIVPVYNAERFLEDCLDSIIAQSFTDFELLLINDGSKDNSGKICDNYALKDKRIRVLHKKNGGASTARKAGIETAVGSFIGWVDADDRISSDMFEVLHDLSISYNADISECQYITIKGDEHIRSGIEEPDYYGEGESITKQFFNAKMKPSFWNKLYKAELFRQIDFPDRQIHVDYYMNLQLSLMPLVYARTAAAKYYYVIRENSNITTYTSREIREAIYLYDYTIAHSSKVSEKIRRSLLYDAINRLVGRYFEVSVNSKLKNQLIYNHIMRKKLGISLIKYLITADIPFKTKISYFLVLSNLKSFQIFIHRNFGKRSSSPLSLETVL